MKTLIMILFGVLISNEIRADYKSTYDSEVKQKFCKNIGRQTFMLMTTYNSNEEEVDKGDQKATIEGARIRSISLTNLNFMANIWIAFCRK